MKKTTSDAAAPSKVDVKKQIRELKAAIATAITEKKSLEVKNLRRQVRRLKAVTRKLASAAPKAAPAEAAPPAA